MKSSQKHANLTRIQHPNYYTIPFRLTLISFFHLRLRFSRGFCYSRFPNTIEFHFKSRSYHTCHLLLQQHSTAHSSHQLNVTSRTVFNLNWINRCLFLSREIERQLATARAVQLTAQLCSSLFSKQPHIRRIEMSITSGSNRHYWAPLNCICMTDNFMQ